MNQNHWLNQELTLQHQQELQKQAENARLAQVAQEAQPANFLAQLHAELLNNKSKEQNQQIRER